MNTWILATNNKKKLAELRRVLDTFGIQAESMSEAGLSMEIEENGISFEENSMIKARAVFRATGKPSIADDSGLEVDALGGAPGIYSARYAGENADDGQRIAKLLSELHDVPYEERKAKFVCVISCVTDENTCFSVRGECRGTVLTQAQGAGGFGYDPVFFYEPLGKTFAQLSGEEKDGVSHRGNALRLLRQKLGEIYNA